MQDLRFALRQFVKQPGFSVVAILIMAIGIGAATTMFSAVNAMVLRPPALPEPERLFAVYESNLPRNAPFFSSSFPNYVDWRERSRSWQSLAAVGSRAMNLGGAKEPEFVRVRTMTASMLPTLGLTPELGRGFMAEEDQPGRNRAAIIGHALWQRRFAGATNIIGSDLLLDGKAYSVVGVLGPGAFFPGGVEIGIPLGADPATERRTNHELDVYGRLKPGVTAEQADAELKTIAAGIWKEHPGLDSGWSTRLVPLGRDQLAPELRTGLFVLLGAVGLVLLIAFANYSNLLLIRTDARSHELAIRTALGAGGGRIARQLLVESLTLAVIGGILGVALSFWAAGVMRSIELPRASEIRVDAAVLAAACGLTLLTGLCAGLTPSLNSSRSRPQDALKDRAPRSGRTSLLRNGMVVSQLALSLALLAGSSMLLRSFWRLQQVDPGFNVDQVLSVSLNAPDNERAAGTYERIGQRVAELPKVSGVGFISNLPLTEGNTSNNIFPVGASPLGAAESVQANWRLVDGGYFGAMQVPVLRGTTFAGLPPEQARASVIVSGSLARMLFGDADPLGRQTERGGRGGAKLTVIGVVGDVRSERLGTRAVPAFYMSMHRFVYGPMRMVVRSKSPTDALAASVRGVVKDIDPAVPVFRVQTMEQFRSESMGRERIVAGLLSGFAFVSLLLAALGTYGVIAFSVQQRTREIGIRMAIGAEKSSVVGLVLRQGARLIAIGIGLGLVASLASAEVFASLLYETSMTDPASYGVAASALALVSFVACLIPARRAARVDPMVALRGE